MLPTGRRQRAETIPGTDECIEKQQANALARCNRGYKCKEEKWAQYCSFAFVCNKDLPTE